MIHRLCLTFLFRFVFALCFPFSVSGAGRFWCKHYSFMIGTPVFINFVDVMGLHFCIQYFVFNTMQSHSYGRSTKSEKHLSYLFPDRCVLFNGNSFWKTIIIHNSLNFEELFFSNQGLKFVDNSLISATCWNKSCSLTMSALRLLSADRGAADHPLG